MPEILREKFNLGQGKAGVSMSRSGRTETAANGDRFIVLEQGRRYEGSPGDEQYRVTEFDRYAARIETRENTTPEPNHKNYPNVGIGPGAPHGPPYDTEIGSGLASAAGSAIGLEGELAQEDEQFEGAKQFVRLAADTVNKAAKAPASADPRTVAQSAAVSAARQLAPGLLSQPTGMSTGAGRGRGQSGRWIRRGNKIVLYGA